MNSKKKEITQCMNKQKCIQLLFVELFKKKEEEKKRMNIRLKDITKQDEMFFYNINFNGFYEYFK